MSVGSVWRHGGGLTSSVRMDWATPRALFEMLDREFHFRLDVCATSKTATAPRYIDKAEDALAQDWGNLVANEPCWMNPPYGRKLGDWVEKAYREAQLGTTVVCLLPARTDTRWFHDYCMKSEIRFLRGRLSFDDQAGRGRAPFPSMIVVFRGK